MSEVLPFHPVTGLQAIGIGKRGPIWPTFGASPDDPSNGGEPADGGAGADGGDDGGDGAGDLTPPAATDWWKFDSKDAAEEWANNLVTKRLSRERKTKLDPLQQMNATLEAEVARLKPFEEATLTDTQRYEAERAQITSELDALRAYKAQAERQELITDIASEVGLDPKFLKFITTDGDADAIKAQAEDLLNALSESGSNTKRKPTPKAPNDLEKPAGGGQAGNGGGGNGDESDEALIASILADTAKARKNGGLRVMR